MQGLGRGLMLAGMLLLLLGLLVTFHGRLPFRIGRLPGDIVIRGRHSVFYFPLATSILASLLVSLIVWLMGRR